MVNTPASAVYGLLREHVFKNPYFAKTSNDQWAFAFFIFGTHLALWYEVFHVLPYYHPTDWPSVVYCHYAFAALVYSHWGMSLFKFISTKATRDIVTQESQEEGNWRYCIKCIGYYPPRSHHCPICDVCILKRDHHCWFCGVCVGHQNHRYYITMVIYMFSAALYANTFHFQYLSIVMGGFGFGTIACVLMPHVAAMTGFLSLHQFFVCGISFLALFCLIMFTWLFGIQIVQLVAGQTKHERKVRSLMYNLGVIDNLRDIFGNRWFLAIWFPWIPSTLPCDGVHFIKSSKDV